MKLNALFKFKNKPKTCCKIKLPMAQYPLNIDLYKGEGYEQIIKNKKEQKQNSQQENSIFNSHIKFIQKPVMNSFQNFHFTSNSQTYHSPNNQDTHYQLFQTKINGKNTTNSQSQSKPKLVEIKLEEKNKRLLWNHSEQIYYQNDSDIEDCTESDPSEPEQILEEDSESEEEEYFCSYYNSSIQPEYLMMSRYQKQNYFDRLNRDYMRKMRVQNSQNLNQNSDCARSQPKQKPAIKFSNIVYQVPFDKQDQPMNVRYTLQEQLHFTEDGQLQMQQTVEYCQSEQETPIRSFNEGSQYFDEYHVLDFDEKVNDQNLSEISKEKSLSEENIGSESDIFRSNIQIPIQAVESIKDPIQPEDSLFEEEQEVNPFKRDSNGKYISETSSSDSNSNDSSNECKEVDYNEEFESYFALFLQGRKINPNAQAVEQNPR